MKRIVIAAGLALTILSCAQHDNKSPDTSGVDPQNPNDTRPLTTGDTANNGRGQTNTGGNAGGTNANNDGTNNNQTINTGDSNLNQNRRNQ